MSSLISVKIFNYPSNVVEKDGHQSQLKYTVTLDDFSLHNTFDRNDEHCIATIVFPLHGFTKKLFDDRLRQFVADSSQESVLDSIYETIIETLYPFKNDDIGSTHYMTFRYKTVRGDFSATGVLNQEYHPYFGTNNPETYMILTHVVNNIAYFDIYDNGDVLKQKDFKFNMDRDDDMNYLPTKDYEYFIYNSSMIRPQKSFKMDVNKICDIDIRPRIDK